MLLRFTFLQLTICILFKASVGKGTLSAVSGSEGLSERCWLYRVCVVAWVTRSGRAEPARSSASGSSQDSTAGRNISNTRCLRTQHTLTATAGKSWTDTVRLHAGHSSHIESRGLAGDMGQSGCFMGQKSLFRHPEPYICRASICL